jgi:5-methyltetrahydropteroyltriglutamate--homocysteine methyltransferase
MTSLVKLRVDQIGGLPCSPEYWRDFQNFSLGRMDAASWRKRQDAAVTEAVRAQEAVDFPILTDGELRRRNFQESFANAVSGFDVPDAARFAYQEGEISSAPHSRAEQNFAAVGPAIFTRRPARERLKLVRNVVLEEFQTAQALSDRPVKVALLGPDRIAQRFDWQNSTSVYRDLDDFVADVVGILREMISGLAKAGCKYIQIDAPGYTAYVDDVSKQRMRERGEDPAENMRRSIAADNAVIAGFPDVTFGIHLCRGNPRTIDPQTGKVMAQWHREGHYDDIAEELFGTLKHERLLLEYDSNRSGGFEPLRFVQKGHVAVLGLVTTKDPALEDADGLIRRVEDAAKHLPLDQLAISPQCGFGGLDPAVMPQQDAWAKLKRLVEVAHRVWG